MIVGLCNVAQINKPPHKCEWGGGTLQAEMLLDVSAWNLRGIQTERERERETECACVWWWWGGGLD